MFNKALIAATVAFFASSAMAGECVRSYTVQENDICDSISAENNVSTYQLQVINEGVIDSTCSNLVPGSYICLGYEGEDCTTTYTVKADDTCNGIYEQHNINSTMLYMNNPQINEACDNLYIGEVLCVSDTVQVPPAPADHAPPAATIPATATPAVQTSTTAQPSPEVTPTPAPQPVAAVAPTPEVVEEEIDEEDLPYCDEL